MIIFFDGDNSPKTRLEGVDKLTNRDELIIYVNSGNGFFEKEKNCAKRRNFCAKYYL